MKASEFRDMSLEELASKLGDLREELGNLQFQHATGQLENPMRLPQSKRDIARLLTVMRQKETTLS